MINSWLNEDIHPSLLMVSRFLMISIETWDKSELGIIRQPLVDILDFGQVHQSLQVKPELRHR